MGNFIIVTRNRLPVTRHLSPVTSMKHFQNTFFHIELIKNAFILFHARRENHKNEVLEMSLPARKTPFPEMPL